MAMNEREAYETYVKKCHSEPGAFVSEFSFEEWQQNGRPKSPDPVDGYWHPAK